MRSFRESFIFNFLHVTVQKFCSYKITLRSFIFNILRVTVQKFSSYKRTLPACIMYRYRSSRKFYIQIFTCNRNRSSTVTKERYELVFHSIAFISAWNGRESPLRVIGSVFHSIILSVAAIEFESHQSRIKRCVRIHILHTYIHLLRNYVCV